MLVQSGPGHFQRVSVLEQVPRLNFDNYWGIISQQASQPFDDCLFKVSTL